MGKLVGVGWGMADAGLRGLRERRRGRCEHRPPVATIPWKDPTPLPQKSWPEPDLWGCPGPLVQWSLEETVTQADTPRAQPQTDLSRSADFSLDSRTVETGR